MHVRKCVHALISNDMICCATLILGTSEIARFDAVRASDVGPSKNQVVVA